MSKTFSKTFQILARTTMTAFLPPLFAPLPPLLHRCYRGKTNPHHEQQRG
jgi:hypothetical protein